MSAAAGGKRILVSGASGLIGTELTRQLEADGHTVLRLVRREPRSANEFQWFPEVHTIDATLPDSTDAVINLSGASTGRLPWTPGYKREILRSRVDATRTLAEAMAVASTPPAVYLSASAVGYYGTRPGVALDESAGKGTGFLADVVDAWEQAAHLAPPSTRVVTFRTGLVVADGGAFTPLGLATRFGLAARIGSGRQYWPWISLYDEAAAIRHLLTSTLSGAVNLAGPTPATSLDVTRSLATAMHRWHALAIPTKAIEFGLGEPGRELLLADQRVVPTALLADGFAFRHSTIDEAIAATWGQRG
jgi:hypothetical protein